MQITKNAMMSVLVMDTKLARSPQEIIPRPFGPIHIVEPTSQHTHTAILLHGRGSTGEEFADELFESKLSNRLSLADKLPGWRWVFPSSQEHWSAVFEEDLPAWFEAHSLTDVNARQDLQMPGIKESVDYLQRILDQEIERLGGRSDRVGLGGISQGAAIGMLTLLCSEHPSRRLGGFVGASTWLPFAENIAETVKRDHGQREALQQDGPLVTEATVGANGFVRGMMAPLLRAKAEGVGSDSLLDTPVFLGHGSDDAYVDAALGRQARAVLTQLGLRVEWKEYEGAEQEGHWLKTPEEVDDIAEFLARLGQ